MWLVIRKKVLICHVVGPINELSVVVCKDFCSLLTAQITAFYRELTVTLLGH
jgi:hypothetical protein